MSTHLSSRKSSSGERPEEWWEVVRRRVSGIRFGSVQVVLHEGRITQVEATERTRFGAGAIPVFLERAGGDRAGEDAETRIPVVPEKSSTDSAPGEPNRTGTRTDF